MKLSKKMSLSAILVAISVVIMLLGSFLETVTLSSAAIASICVMVAVVELGYKYAAMVYVAASFLSFILLPVKDPAIFFAASFGFYPIVKALLEKIRSKISYLYKGLVFTAAFAFLYFVAIKFLAPQVDLMKYLFIIYPVALIVFFIFDYAFSKLTHSYCNYLRKRLGIDKLLK